VKRASKGTERCLDSQSFQDKVLREFARRGLRQHDRQSGKEARGVRGLLLNVGVTGAGDHERSRGGKFVARESNKAGPESDGRLFLKTHRSLHATWGIEEMLVKVSSKQSRTIFREILHWGGKRGAKRN